MDKVADALMESMGKEWQAMIQKSSAKKELHEKLAKYLVKEVKNKSRKSYSKIRLANFARIAKSIWREKPTTCSPFIEAVVAIGAYARSRIVYHIMPPPGPLFWPALWTKKVVVL